MSAGNLIIPEDYRDLLAVHGPGTLCGVLRLLAPGGPDGFRLGAGQLPLPAAISGARLWGVFTTGETCWWLPIRDDPADWLVLLTGHGWQQLNIPTTSFLTQWAEGTLDLPVLTHGPARREWQLTPAGQPVTVPELPADAVRDPLAQLATIVGPGHPEPVSYDWAAIEADLRRPLPPDYKRLHETYGSNDPRDDFLAWNGIFTSSPLTLKTIHDSYQESILEEWSDIAESRDLPAAGDLLFCGSTEGRDLLAWDTRNPDPARWPVICIPAGDAQVFPGTLTGLYVAELTGTGPGLSSLAPGDPATRAWPLWGPDAPPGP